MTEKYDITVGSGIGGATPRTIAKKYPSRDGYWFYLGIAGQIGYTIAIPLVAGALIGSYFGQTLIGLGIGILVSGIGFIRIIKKLV